MLVGLFSACTSKTDDSADPVCSETQPEACLYVTDNTYTVQTSTTQFQDPARVGGPRPISLIVFEPSEAPDDLPVLLLTPGGPYGDGTNPAGKAADAWASSLAQAGNLVVIVDLRERSLEAKTALCESLGIAETDCAAFKAHTWDAPKDAQATISWLQSDAAENTWSDRIGDATFGHVGQELGASTSLMLAGATRKFGETAQDLSDNRIAAVMPIAMFSDGGGTDFLETGLGLVATPVYMTGGINGYQSSNVPIDTPDAFSNFPTGDKYLLHFLEEDANMATFHLDAAGCESGTGGANCEQYLQWLSTSSVAFSDAYFQEDADAIDWLNSDHMQIAIGNQAEWLTR